MLDTLCFSKHYQYFYCQFDAVSQLLKSLQCFTTQISKLAHVKFFINSHIPSVMAWNDKAIQFENLKI